MGSTARHLIDAGQLSGLSLAAVVLFIFCVFAFAKRPFGALAICLAVIPLLDMPYEHSYTKRENLLGGFVEKLEL